MKKFTLSSFLMFVVLCMFSFSYAQNVISVPQDEAPSMLQAPHQEYVNTPACVANAKFPTDVAYAYTVSTTTQGPISFTLNNPGTLTLLSDQSAMDWVSGASYANGVWYGATYNATSGSSLVTLDKVTGNRTIIGTMGGKSVTGLAYDWTSNVMYALTYEGTTTKLYTVNLATGGLTLVGNSGAYLGICLGCSTSGVLYTVNLGTDNLGTVDKTTGLFTAVGPIGFNANYAQDMEFDNSDGTMYYAAYNYTTAPGQGELRTVDLTTGNTTLIGVFEGNAEIAGLAIVNTTVGVDEYAGDNGIYVYPNPATSQLTVTTEDHDITKLSMLNNLGQTVFESTPTEKSITINTSDLVRGIYFVVIETEKGKTTRKVAVE